MKKTSTFLILCAYLLGLITAAETLQKPEFIGSPLDWATGYFQASRGDGTHLARIELDLNHDGRDELFLGWAAARGRNGMPFLVFQRSDAGYLFLGELFFRQNLVGFKVLPLSDDNEIRFAQYWAHGGCEGTISIYTHDGNGFTIVDSEAICAGDSGTERGNRRFREVFGD